LPFAEFQESLISVAPILFQEDQMMPARHQPLAQDYHRNSHLPCETQNHSFDYPHAHAAGDMKNFRVSATAITNAFASKLTDEK
jgi:hypothetical protein